MSFFATRLDYLLARREKLLWELEDFGKRGMTAAAASSKAILNRYVLPAIEEEHLVLAKRPLVVGTREVNEWGDGF